MTEVVQVIQYPITEAVQVIQHPIEVIAIPEAVGPPGKQGPPDTSANEALEALDDLPSFSLTFENGLL